MSALFTGLPQNLPHTASRFDTAALGFAVLLCLMGAAGCRRSGNAETPSTVQDASAATIRVETRIVETRDLVRRIELPGTVEGFANVDLYAKVGGYLAGFHKDLDGKTIDIGSRVAKDQPLATLAIPEMEKRLAQKQALVDQADADVEQALAAVEQAQAKKISAQAALDEARTELAEKTAKVSFREAEYRRYAQLVDSGAARRELLDEAGFQREAARAARETTKARIRTAEALLAAVEADLAKARADHKAALARRAVAQADLEYVQTMMRYATIRAPFDGLVTRRWVDPGAFIQPAEANSAARPVLAVTHIDTVRIFVDVPLADVGALDVGDKAFFDRLPALPGRRFTGEVTRFVPAVEPRSRMMRIEIDLNNPEGVLRPGYYGYVTLELERFADTPWVPATAVQTEERMVTTPDGFSRVETRHHVFVVEDGTARKRDVTINYDDGAIVGIASGLRTGEEVVVTGAGQLRDGQKVETRRTP